MDRLSDSTRRMCSAKEHLRLFRKKPEKFCFCAASSDRLRVLRLTCRVRQGGVGAGVEEAVGPGGVVAAACAGLRGPGEVHRVLGAGRGGGAAVGREGARRGARGAGAEVGQVRPILQKYKHKTLIWSLFRQHRSSDRRKVTSFGLFRRADTSLEGSDFCFTILIILDTELAIRRLPSFQVQCRLQRQSAHKTDRQFFTAPVSHNNTLFQSNPARCALAVQRIGFSFQLADLGRPTPREIRDCFGNNKSALRDYYDRVEV